MAVIFLIICGVACLVFDLLVWLIKIVRDANPNGELPSSTAKQTSKKKQQKKDAEVDVVKIEELYED